MHNDIPETFDEIIKKPLHFPQKIAKKCPKCQYIFSENSPYTCKWNYTKCPFIYGTKTIKMRCPQCHYGWCIYYSG